MRITTLLITATLITPMTPMTPTTIETMLADIPDEQRFDIVIRNYDFEVIHRTPITLGKETAIILRNQDIVRHGFTSPVLPQLSLRIDGEAPVRMAKASTACMSSQARHWSFA